MAYQQNWYEPEIEIETAADHGWIHEDELPNMDHCKDMLEGLIEAVYKSGNVVTLTDCLEELTSQFGLDIPNTAPLLGNKASIRTNSMLGEWLQLNHSYNENLLTNATR